MSVWQTMEVALRLVLICLAVSHVHAELALLCTVMENPAMV